MFKGCYALFTGGIIIVFIADFFKKVHKSLLGFTTTQNVAFFHNSLRISSTMILFTILMMLLLYF